MKCLIVTLLVFSAITGEETTTPFWSEVPLGYSIQNMNSRLEFNCVDFSNSTLSAATQDLDSDLVKELKMCGCAANVLISAVEMFKNLSVLDFSHSQYRSEDWSKPRSSPYLNLQKLRLASTITKLNASHNNLSHLRVVLPSNITVIDFSHNKLDLIYRTFSNLEKLELLDLSNNSLFFIKSETFENLPSLKILRLENNPIDIYNCEVFRLLRNPATIYISWHNIYRLDMNCRHINNVNVRLNSQQSVTYLNGEVEMYCNQRGLRKLHYLHIGRIRIIDTTVSQTLTSLRHLRVSNSKAAEFDFGPLRDMTSLEYLDISGNGFKRVRDWAVLRRFRKLICLWAQQNQIQNAYEMIPNLSVVTVHLNLAENHVGRINSNFFHGLPFLKEINLQKAKLQFEDANPFQLLDDLKVLDISHNDLSNIDFTKVASTLGRLKVFKAAGCQLENVSQVIKLFGADIREIDLSGNDLSEVNISIAFTTFHYLEKLNLSHCQLKNVADLRVKPRSIRSIDLSGNPIGEVTNSTFNHLRELGELYLSDTNLSISYPDPFEYIVSWRSLVFLGHLDLSKNDLSSLNFSMLSSTIGKLHGINLSYCQIKNVTKLIKLLNPSIQKLDLSGNFIGDTSSFYHFDDLRTLNLANTSLRNFNLTFDNMERLQVLNISFNHLKTLELSHSAMVETLDLRDNELSEIPNFTRYNLPYLQVLGISGNRLSWEFLEGLNEWRDLKFIDNPWNQKDVNCRSF